MTKYAVAAEGEGVNRQELEDAARKILEEKLSCDDVSVYVCLIDHKITYKYRRFSSGRIDDIEIWLPVYLQQAPQDAAEDIISCLAVRIRTGKKIRYRQDTLQWIADNRSE